MESKRQQRINQLLQQDFSELFQRDFVHLGMGAMITVTKIVVTPDLSVAKVYLSLFATKKREEVIANIRKHTSEIRGKLGQRIRHQLRIVPELYFYIDDSLDYIEKIENLLKDK